jgi:hypothetical protein
LCYTCENKETLLHFITSCEAKGCFLSAANWTVSSVSKVHLLVRTRLLTLAVKMNGKEKCSRGNVIVSALTRFLKIGTQSKVKRKVS